MPVWEKSPDVDPSKLGMTNYEGFLRCIAIHTPLSGLGDDGERNR